MKYRNRLSGEVREDLTGILLAGLWQAQGKDPSVSIQLQGYALPQDAQHKCLPGELETQSIRLIAKKLEEFSSNNNTWLDWNEVSPLVPNISEQGEKQDLERFLLSEDSLHLHHLQQVCALPHTHLRTEAERVHVSRARRVDKNAVTYLAAHTKDWEKRTLWGVQPRHILAKIRYEMWDIYENRVAARLIDHLLVYLNRRISKLQKIIDTLVKLTNYDVSGYYRLQRRIYTLWGGPKQDKQQDKQAEEYTRNTLAELQKLKYQLLGMMGSVLYKQVPRLARVANQLTMTNILLNDPYYRSVGVLWQEWMRHGAEKSKITQAQYQDLCQGFNQFCLLLVVRAFAQLAYEPVDDSLETPLDETNVLVLKGWHGQIDLEIQKSGILQLIENDNNKPVVRLRILPLLASLSTQSLKLQQQAYLELAASLVKPEAAPPLTLILYPGESNDHLSLCLHSLPHESEGLFENLGLMPVSPWEIASVEQVAYALRRALMAPFLLHYPPKIELNKLLEADAAIPNWLKKADPQSKKWCVIQPVADYEVMPWLQK
ncbi:DUF2357 domain-containing protein, partial [Candidatus Venteria ishoeyi]|uniref:DUF2357 domain-containing protein n=1 Tax=Candidatus Venteria ishoeyi TaxID=1899563 RepID=UPI0025A5C705